MISGKKNTGEKILLNFAKKLQKSNNKEFKKLIQLAIINSTLTFKLNEQIVKKGKRKVITNNPFFIMTDLHRVMISLKLIKYIGVKNKNFNSFYMTLASEVLLASNQKGHSVDKKLELQKQVLLNKRYLSKFYW